MAKFLPLQGEKDQFNAPLYFAHNIPQVAQIYPLSLLSF